MKKCDDCKDRFLCYSSKLRPKIIKEVDLKFIGRCRNYVYTTQLISYLDFWVCKQGILAQKNVVCRLYDPKPSLWKKFLKMKEKRGQFLLKKRGNGLPRYCVDCDN